MPDFRGCTMQVEENSRRNGVIIVHLLRFHKEIPQCIALNALTSHILFEGYPPWVKKQLEVRKIPIIQENTEPTPISQ